MEMSIIAVGNIFLDLESGKKCRVKEIFYAPKEKCTTVIFRFQDETEIRVQGEALIKISESFAKISGF